MATPVPQRSLVTPALAATSVKVPSWLLWKRAAWGGVALPVEGVHRGAVDDIDVEPAVVVVVDEAHAGALGLDDVILCGRAHFVGPVGQAGFLRVVHEDDGAGLHEAAGGDGHGQWRGRLLRPRNSAGLRAWGKSTGSCGLRESKRGNSRRQQSQESGGAQCLKHGCQYTGPDGG